MKACQNVQYCISSVWSKKHYSGPSDNVCQICLEMVKEARDVLQSNETMVNVKKMAPSWKEIDQFSIFKLIYFLFYL